MRLCISSNTISKVHADERYKFDTELQKVMDLADYIYAKK